LANLVAGHDLNREQATSNGAVGRLLTTIKSHGAQAGVQDSAVRALTNLAVNDDIKVRAHRSRGGVVFVSFFLLFNLREWEDDAAVFAKCGVGSWCPGAGGL
jgi:hypothetical protein